MAMDVRAIDAGSHAFCQRATGGETQGPWGLGIVRASVEESPALRDSDPVIRSGRGFRYETLPMMRAIVRE